MPTGDRHDLAVFIDFENIALGLRGREEGTFNIQKVLERLLEKGKIIVKRAYADWSRFSAYTRSFHEAAIELIEIPRRASSGKNSADIRLCVDAMDLCYSKEHIDTFVIVSGDSDFSPLVSKLRENGKRLIGLGLRDSTSNLLVSNCDEFIYYEALIQPDQDVQPAAGAGLSKDKADVLALAANTVGALLREGRDPIQASLVKDTIKRKQPSFDEREYGFRSFTELLEEGRAQGMIELREDPRSGTHSVSLPKPKEKPRSRGRRRRPSTQRRPAAAAPAVETPAPPEMEPP
jgi:uncharacterized protein (TIGR00288 family)